jgi:hypothetical protein
VRTEVVRGRLDDATAEQLVGFWTGHGALDEAAARQRLDQVVCVLYDGSDEVAGVNSAYVANAPLVGRPFWIYRRFVRPDVDVAAEGDLLNQAFDELARGFGGGTDPLGLCVVVTEPALMEANPEAEWPATGLLYAGCTGEGAQVRIRYFEGATI